jgi:hypothetical protein
LFVLVGLLSLSSLAPSVETRQAPRPPAAARPAASAAIPRAANGRPDLQGIWKVRSRAAYNLEDHSPRFGMPAGLSVVEGGTIPYLPAAAKKRAENFATRAKSDPLNECYMPGVPRIMYMEHPFQIFQTPEEIAITFEWQLAYRLITTDGSKPPDGLEFWMGDSRGRWEGDTLVVDVTQHNDRTWFDMAGNFHSEALKVVERYTMVDADTIRYEATIEDPKVFARPWKITVPFERQTGLPRVLEYHCRAEMEEARGDFEADPRTWYLGPGAHAADPLAFTPALPAAAASRPASPLPDFSGFYQADHGGANWGLEPHPKQVDLTPAGRGVVIDPPDRMLPYQPWARKERLSRDTPERGYDDPTAHCFVSAGVPRSFYTPSPFHILQTATHVVFLYERMSWRIVTLDGRQHLPDAIRLWNGDSVGRWEGPTLVVDTRNFNGRTWLNEVGDVVSRAQTVLERFTPKDAKTVIYQATVSDPLVYTRPWTIELPLNRQPDQLLEVACLEDNQDLQHLKDVRDEARRKAQGSGGQP